MITAGDLSALIDNVRTLGHRHEIPLVNIRGGTQIGAFTNTPHNELEFVAHEGAHLLVAGLSVKRFPKNIPEYIDKRSSKLSPCSADSQELDAAIVTFHALRQLEVYTGDIKPLGVSAYRNLQHGLLQLTQAAVLKELEQRMLWDDKWYKQKAEALAAWLRGS